MLSAASVEKVVLPGGLGGFRERKQQTAQAMLTLDGLTGTAVTDTGPQTHKQLRSAPPEGQRALPAASPPKAAAKVP